MGKKKTREKKEERRSLLKRNRNFRILAYSTPFPLGSSPQQLNYISCRYAIPATVIQLTHSANHPLFLQLLLSFSPQTSRTPPLPIPKPYCWLWFGVWPRQAACLRFCCRDSGVNSIDLLYLCIYLLLLVYPLLPFLQEGNR